MKYDLIIIGMGISGISAAIYAKNSNLNLLMLEAETPGGLLNKINKINNYPGYAEITGPELSLKLFESINQLKIPYKVTTVTNIKVENDEKIVETTTGIFKTNAIIIATGRQNKKLMLEHEDELLGQGISTCATCDGALYKDKEVAIVGGGNSALEEALYLAPIVKKIYLIHYRDWFRAEEGIINKVKQTKNIEILYNSSITSLVEKNKNLDGIIVNNEQEIKVSALFISIGYEPNNNFVKDLNILDEKGYIEVDKNYETKIKKIYAVGDCIKKDVYQLVTGASEGAIAAINVIKNK